MPRTSYRYRPIVALGLVASALAYVGCNSGSNGPGDGGASKLAIPSPSAGKDHGDGPPLAADISSSTKQFADWPAPAGALVISGQQNGYLEPCGCTSGQLGGLRRRYDFITRLREQNWPLVLVDLGSLIKDPAASRGGLEQTKAKFGVALTALGMMKYDAVALSADDLKVGVDEALGQYLNLGEKPKIVVANVQAASGFEKTVQPSLRAKAGPIAVGITAVLDPEELKRLADPAKEVLLPIVTEPEKALPAVLADLEKDTQTQILLVQGPPEMARTLAGKFPGFDIVVATSHVDPDAEPETLNNGKTMLVSVGNKGKYVGVVGLYQDPKHPYRYGRLTLSSRYNGKAEPMRKLIEDDFQEMLKQRGVVENFPRRDYTDGIPGSTFAGAESCKTCHPGTYARWAATQHAHAFENIVTDPKGERSDHQFDAECVSCHTTGFEYKTGWVSAATTPYLKGNQCENCHGPASKHVEEPDNAAFRKAIARTAEAADKTRLCNRCHDEDNSPKFDFATYWGKVAHKGLDTYNDPKVHQGLKPEEARAQSK